MNPMTHTQATTDTTPAAVTAGTTVTDDTLEALGRQVGNSRAAYWSAVDRTEYLAFMPGTSTAEVVAGQEDVARLLTLWREAESALEAYRAGLNTRSHSAAGVVFVAVEEYAAARQLVAA